MGLKSGFESLPSGVKTGLKVGGVIALVAITIWGGIKLVNGLRGASIKHDTKHNKSFYASWLIENGFANDAQMTFLLGATEDYVQSWYEAAKKNKDSFLVDNKTYNIKGGKAISIRAI